MSPIVRFADIIDAYKSNLSQNNVTIRIKGTGKVRHALNSFSLCYISSYVIVKSEILPSFLTTFAV